MNMKLIDLSQEEKVTIPKLMQKTGLSRGFFYKNNIVRGELGCALECQVGMINPIRNIINQALDRQICKMQRKIVDLERKNEQLTKANKRLRRILDQKSVNLMKKL